jgi:superfamily II DNA/RNA helicase
MNNLSPPCIRALIVLPTRELARQVEHVFRVLVSGHHGSARVSLYAPLDGQLPSLEELKHQAICITTPGRLVEALDRKELVLGDLRWLIIDEADRLFRQTYQDWLERTLQLIDAQQSVFQPPLRRVRKLLFSATQAREATYLAALRLYQPVFFLYEANARLPPNQFVRGTLRTDRVPAELAFRALRFESEKEKLLFLMHLMDTRKGLLDECEQPSDHSIPLQTSRFLIFTKSVETAHRLCRFLQLAQLSDPWTGPRALSGKRGPEATHSIEEITKRVPATVRAATLERFQRDVTRCLVCSDVMARGMDISGASHVVNFDVPAHATTFLHRVGRVGRAGRRGTALTFLLRNQVGYFQSEIMAQVGVDKQQDRGIVSVKHLDPELAEESTHLLGQRILTGVSLLLELEQMGLVDSFGSLDPLLGRFLLQQAEAIFSDEAGDRRSRSSSKLAQRALTVIALQNWCRVSVPMRGDEQTVDE